MSIWSRLSRLEAQVKSLEKKAGVEPWRAEDEWFIPIFGREISLGEKIQAILNYLGLRIYKYPEAIKAEPIIA